MAAALKTLYKEIRRKHRNRISECGCIAAEWVRTLTEVPCVAPVVSRLRPSLAHPQTAIPSVLITRSARTLAVSPLRVTLERWPRQGASFVRNVAKDESEALSDFSRRDIGPKSSYTPMCSSECQWEW